MVPEGRTCRIYDLHKSKGNQKPLWSCISSWINKPRLPHVLCHGNLRVPLDSHDSGFGGLQQFSAPPTCGDKATMCDLGKQSLFPNWRLVIQDFSVQKSQMSPLWNRENHQRSQKSLSTQAHDFKWVFSVCSLSMISWLSFSPGFEQVSW